MPKRLYKLTAAQRRLRYAGRRAAVWGVAIVAIAGMVLADRVGIFGWAPVPDPVKYDGNSFVVVRVVDGDTLDIDIPDGRRPTTRIRLWGVDTPETVKPNTPVQYFGPEASAFATRAALGKRVRLELDLRQPRDKYKRLLAYVFLPDGRMLNRTLIEEGYGYADPRFGHRLRGEFVRLQRAAMKARRGLWKSVRRAELPYYYRDLKLPDE